MLYFVISQNLATVESLNGDYYGTLSGLNWLGDPMLSSTLQSSLANATVNELCRRENVS